MSDEWEARAQQIVADLQVLEEDMMTREHAYRVASAFHDQLVAAGVSDEDCAGIFTKMLDAVFRDPSLTDVQRDLLVDVFSDAFGLEIVRAQSSDGYTGEYRRPTSAPPVEAVRSQSMFELLKRLAARLVGRRPPSSGPTQDPHAGVREPRNGAPGSRNSSVAVMEPEPDQSVSAIGQLWRRRPR